MKARVRMYQVGLGDCFVLSFWDREDDPTPKHVLVDCGVLLGTPDGTQIMRQTVEQIREELGGLHAVVATHQHWDHISGFNQARAIFDDLPVDEVWLGWTEDPHDAQATRLRADRSLKLAALQASVRRWQALGETAAGTNRAQGLTQDMLSFFGDLGATGTRSTADAQRYLDSELACDRRRFLEPGDSFAVRGVQGLRVFVLGPPRDEALLHKDRPSTRDPETYHVGGAPPTEQASLLAACEDSGCNATVGNPFDAYYRVPMDEAQTHPVFAPRYFQGPSWRTIDADWLEPVGELALALDSDTNNTSLVLAFELGDGGDVILMAGDAQVGSWLSWPTVEFRYRVGNERRRVSAEELLSRVVLYKVGHHASHNATVSEGGLESMVHEGLVAMIPVDEQMARNKKWTMPFPPLLQRLNDKTRGRVIRLDEGLPDPKSLGRLDASERSAFAAATREVRDADGRPLYVEIELGSDPPP